MFTHALLRHPGPDCASGLTRRRQDRANHRRLCEQHRRYSAVLQHLGLTTEVLTPLHGYSDAYFVEDCAVITPHVAVITRPGAPSRRGEAAAIIPALARHRPTAVIQAPGTLDGGDVLMVGHSCFIGLSQRTNMTGAKQLDRLLKAHGLHTTFIPVTDWLYLKSGVSHVRHNTLLITEAYEHLDAFESFQRIAVHADEAESANSLWVNGCLLMPAGFPRTKAKLATLGQRIIEVEVGEARKRQGGLTCMSLRL